MNMVALMTYDNFFRLYPIHFMSNYFCMVVFFKFFSHKYYIALCLNVHDFYSLLIVHVGIKFGVNT